MISVWGITDRGVIRKQNQDTCYFETRDEGCAFGLVCDGMGGAKAGDVASQMAVAVFKRQAEQHDFAEENDEMLLRQVVKEANQEIYFQADVHPEYDGMGTTLVAAILRENRVTVANVGDSRAYILKARKLRQITQDHSLVGDLVRQGNITPEQARRHPQKNLITRALGTNVSVAADLFTQSWEEGDILLLCSDGLVNEVTDEEIGRALAAGDDLETIGRSLLDLTIRRGAPDNVTIVLFCHAPGQKEGG